MVEPAGDWSHAQTVTDDVRDQAPAAMEVDRLLLDAKLSVPQPRRGSVSRSRLIEAARASGCRVVGITAPAGYGKSTLLSMGAGRGSSGRLGVPQRLRRRPRGPAHPAGLRLRSRLAGQRRPGRRHGRSGRVALGRSAPLLAAVLSNKPSPVRTHVGRPPRAPVTGLPRCPGSSHLGDTSRVSARGSESFRAAPRPAATSGR